MAKALSEYNKKRNFTLTSEPQETPSITKRKDSAHALRFVIQKHDARRLHYDFRLELDGTLKSWAIPKGPSLDPHDKRLAVHVEDHPLAYASFEGTIPEGQYGGGEVIVWDQGIWQPQENASAAYKAGKLKFTLIGEKLSGDWALVRTNLRGNGDKEQWLLIKERDESARPASDYNIVEAQPQSVLSGAVITPKKSSPTSTKKAATVKTTSHKKRINSDTDTQAHNNAADTDKKSTTAEIVSVPEDFAPELATLVSEPPAGEWLYEIKFDGYRLLARVLKGEVKLFTRNGNDWTARLPLQAKAIAALGLKDSWLDGEVVVLDDQGLPDFQALQNAFDLGRSHNIVYYLFDAPFLNGRDLRAVPLEKRRAELEKIIPGSRTSPLRFSAAFTAEHRNLIDSACAMSLEGLIGKRAGSNYVSGRSLDWIKLKCRLRQEFVIVGYTAPQGNRNKFGALLLAVHEEAGKPELQYVGRVGTGFDENSLHDIHKSMSKLQRDTSPLASQLTGAQARGVQWIEPKLVCEVEFAAWTTKGILRQASFISLRTDKPAKEIIREQARSVEDIKSGRRKTTPSVQPAKKKNSVPLIATIKITHPDRVIDPDSGATKQDLALFYDDIQPWLLPELKGRPVSLLRAPNGIEGKQFFQKHVAHLAIPDIKQLDPALDPGHARLMEIDTPQAVVGAVQMGTIEFHTWGATSANIETPDRIVLDLDPDPALPWRSVIEATRLALAVLDELNLNAYLKTTGGKGMHIVVPLARHADWNTVKAFSKAIAQFMAAQLPERFVAKMGPQNRIGKIFIDYLRNQRGASIVAAYSVRARPGLPVSVPIARDELNTVVTSSQWTIGNLHERLDSGYADPWASYKNRQKITQAMWKKLGLKAPS